jgi:TRAP transporter 4TM/12TM fusion protein
MRKYLLVAGKRRSLEGPYPSIVKYYSVAIALYVFIASQLYPEPILHRTISFALFFSLIFIVYDTPGVKASRRPPLYDWLLAGLSIAVALYMALNLDRILSRRPYLDALENIDIFMFFLTVFLIIEGSRRTIGFWLPLLSVISVSYLFMGHAIPGRFGHQGFTLIQIIEGTFFTTSGIWGSSIGIASGQVMIFIFFGVFFTKSGAGDFLYEFAAAFAGKSRGGIAKVAVISSAMFGMISGGPVTNVSTTGNITIPAMIKHGYSKEFAAATESCASIAGTFTPPVMGSIVFIMSDIVGVSYSEIARRAAIPAIIFYVTLFFIIDARSKKLGLGGMEKPAEGIIKTASKGINFFLPLIYLIVRILSGISISKTGIETIAIILAMGLFGRKKVFNLKTIVESLELGIHRGITIFSTMATAGVMIGAIYISGITGKFSSLLMSVSRGSILLSLLVMMLITIFLGLAMNTISSYIITAVIFAPLIVMQGYEPLSVHLFIIYFAASSSITPPVAMTSYIAASIADASPLEVSLMAMKLGLVAYILPFIFILKPELLLYGTLDEIALVIVLTVIGGYLIANLSEMIIGNSKREIKQKKILEERT